MRSVTTVNFSVSQGNCNEINSSRQLHGDHGVVITETGYSRTAVRYRELSIIIVTITVPPEQTRTSDGMKPWKNGDPRPAVIVTSPTVAVASRYA